MRQVLRAAQRLGAQPVMAKSDETRRLPNRAERMHVAMAFAAPAIERDAELEAAFCLAQELGLVDAQRLVEMANLWDRRFANSDRADCCAFDQLDPVVRRQEPGQQCRRHPASGPAAGDQDAKGAIVIHGSTLFPETARCGGAFACETLERIGRHGREEPRRPFREKH